MSADNWGYCPKCNKKRADALGEAKKQYGKIPVEEYTKLIEQAKKTIPPIENTLREDYEIGVDQNGEFSVHFTSLCMECGFSFSFQHTQKALT